MSEEAYNELNKALIEIHNIYVDVLVEDLFKKGKNLNEITETIEADKNVKMMRSALRKAGVKI